MRLMYLKDITLIGCTAWDESGFSQPYSSIEKGKINPGNKKKRHWRTRKDPFEEVWDTEIVPQLKQCPALTPITLFEDLQKNHPGEYPDSKLRTFQRKVRQWKALYGPNKEVMFLQEQQVGKMAISDFTKLKKFSVTIDGQPFDHLLYHFSSIL